MPPPEPAIYGESVRMTLRIPFARFSKKTSAPLARSSSQCCYVACALSAQESPRPLPSAGTNQAPAYHSEVPRRSRPLGFRSCCARLHAGRHARPGRFNKQYDHYATHPRRTGALGTFTQRMVNPDRGDYTASFKGKKDSYIFTMTPKNLDAQHRSFYAEDDGKIHGDESKPADGDSPVLK